MKKNYLLFSCSILLAFSCSAPKNNEENQSLNSIVWELQILDSIQVDYLGNISTGDFSEGIGLIYDYTANTIVKIDYDGKVLTTQTFPKDGPNSISFISTIKIDPEGNPLISNHHGPFYKLNGDLTIQREIEMPFTSPPMGGLMDDKSLEFWQENILLYYTGRDDVGPFTENYLKEYFLLEKLNPTTGESSPLIRTPETSKFSTGKFYERPSISFTISENDLLLYFNNEPKIHRFNLLDSGSFIETIDLKPTKFIEAPELKDKYENYNYEKLVEGNVFGVFAEENQFVVHYSEGISEEIYSTQEFDFPKDFPKLIDLNQSYLKVYNSEKGWSNEIPIPKKVYKIFAMEGLNQPFFALRNDEYLGEEQDYLTFYKLQLVQK
ncbi:hypothetical protein [Algoriphagus chordae]|uniref:DUF4221 domain-containing protein n=1 Tax=Algoriphagus chordae TaxID=237019 RepID=A0A2W7SHI6_9BACT|nr:hypothetical protein [Algoriphagus chordae]PZX50202.1 hypothetical protein LV85_02820 [Algoriphagus chordae]